MMMLSFGVIFPTGMVLGVRMGVSISGLVLTRVLDRSESMACTGTGIRNDRLCVGIFPRTST